MAKFKNHNGDECLYVQIKDGYILIMDDTFEEHYEFYYIPLGDYLRNKGEWQRQLSEKNWGTPELLDEINRQVSGSIKGAARVR